MSDNSIDYIDRRYRSIFFRGFQYRPEEQDRHGWVYWLPRYLNTHSSLSVYIHDGRDGIVFLDKSGNLHEVSPKDIPPVEIFFGRTIGSYDKNDRLCASAKLKILYPVGNSVPKALIQEGVSIIEDRDFIKPIPEFERRFFYFDNSNRENIILYPAAIHHRKGQLDFAKQVSKLALKGHKLLFCGTIKSESYAGECFDTLRKKKIDFEYLSKVSKQNLGKLYRRSKITLILSKQDWNPRTFYESMACGTPCMLSQQVRLAASVERFAVRASRFFPNRTLAHGLECPHEFRQQMAEASLGITESDCYHQLFSVALAGLR